MLIRETRPDHVQHNSQILWGHYHFMFEVLLSFGYDDLNATPKVKLGCLEILEKGPFFVSKK